MTDLERRMAWPGAKDAILRASLVEMAEWPDALTPDQIGALHARKPDGSSNLVEQDELSSFLQTEIDEGRVEAVIVIQDWINPIWVGGEAPVPMKIQVRAIAMGDCARVLAGIDVGKYLEAWLAPYLKEAADPSNANEDGLTEMRRAAIISQLGRRYPSLAADFNRPEDWIKKCNTGRRGLYYLELIEKGCSKKWGDGNKNAAPSAAVLVHKMRG